jgi:hypothetical protein
MVNIIEISSLIYKKNDIEKRYTDIIAVKTKDFTGDLSINSLSRNSITNWVFKNGSVDHK